MVMIKQPDGTEYSLSSDIHSLVERIKKKINSEDSMFLVPITGKVGCGKSLFAQRFGYAIDPTLDVSRICFSKEEFIDAVLNSRNKVIIADEGIAIFFSRAVMTREGRLISELMAQIRQKNLCVLICVPELTSLDKLILSATDMVIHCWEGSVTKNGKKYKTKGNVAIYPEFSGDPYKTRIIKYKQIKHRNPFAKIFQPQPWCTQMGGFIGESCKKPTYPVGEDVYRAKKESILDKYKFKEQEKEKPQKSYRTMKKEIVASIIKKAKANYPSLSDKNIGKVIGYSRKRVNTLRNQGEKVNPALNVRYNIPENVENEIELELNANKIKKNIKS